MIRKVCGLSFSSGLLALLVIGCASSPSKSNAPTRGAGLRDYRQVVCDIQKATVASRHSLDALTTASSATGPAALNGFEESLHELEVASVMARAKADAMEKRGAAYFEEWETGLTNNTSDQAAKERLTELRGHFETILQGSKQVRQDFRQYLDGLRQLRHALSGDVKKTNLDEARPAVSKSIEEGQKAEHSMDELLVKVDAALAAVMTGPAPPPFKP